MVFGCLQRRACQRHWSARDLIHKCGMKSNLRGYNLLLDSRFLASEPAGWGLLREGRDEKAGDMNLNLEKISHW